MGSLSNYDDDDDSNGKKNISLPPLQDRQNENAA